MQITFEAWLLGQVDIWIANVRCRLQDEADQDETAFDYEELDHALDAADLDREYIQAFWQAPV